MIKIAAMRIKCLEYMLNHAQQEIIYKNNSLMNFGGKKSIYQRRQPDPDIISTAARP